MCGYPGSAVSPWCAGCGPRTVRRRCRWWCSDRPGEQTAVEALSAGADDYVRTPFSAVELLARVRGRLRLGATRRAAERRFQSMADSTPALISVDDSDGMRVFVNQGWLDFTGVDEMTAELGRAWRRWIHPLDRERYRSVTMAAMRAGAPFEVEYPLLRRDGSHRWVLDRGARSAATTPGPPGTWGVPRHRRPAPRAAQAAAAGPRRAAGADHRGARPRQPRVPGRGPRPVRRDRAAGRDRGRERPAPRAGAPSTPGVRTGSRIATAGRVMPTTRHR